MLKNWARARFNSFSAQWNLSDRKVKNFNRILFSYGSDIRCHLTWLKYWRYKILTSSWKILAHAKRSQSSTEIKKKLKPLSNILNTMIWSKNPSHSTVTLMTTINGCLRSTARIKIKQWLEKVSCWECCVKTHRLDII